MMTTKKDKAPIITIVLDGTVDIGLVTQFAAAKKAETKGKVIYESLVSTTKQAQKLMLDVIPQIEDVAGVSPILILNGEKEPVVQLGKAKATTTLDVSEFIDQVLSDNGVEPAVRVYLISALTESGLMDLINIKAKEAKEVQFVQAYEAASTVEHNGVRLVKPLL